MPPRPQGGVKRAPPSEISCAACGHLKHPRSLKCKNLECQCECLQMHLGVKRKKKAETRAKNENADETFGTWHSGTHKKITLQASFAAERMWKSRAVYAVLAARFCEHTNSVVTECWGSEPWVGGELLGKTGVLEIVFRQHAQAHIGTEPLDGLGDFAKVREVLTQAGLGALFPQFVAARFDAAAFSALGRLKDHAFADGALCKMGVDTVGDRLKLFDMARLFAERKEGGEGEDE
jgi:hypothetical protein